MAGYIDAHVHVWTPDTDKYPLAEGFAKADMNPPSFTPEELLAHARPAGVSRIVLIQMSFYRFDNSYMLDAIAGYPGVFSGVGIVDDRAARPDEAMRSLAARGVWGFRVTPSGRTAGQFLSSESEAAMWKCGADEGLAICPLINPPFLAAVDRMCGRYPETTVVIDHFARVGITGRIDPAELDQLCALARHKRVYVKTSAFYALGGKQAPYTDLAPMIRRVLEAFGPERLMWASDCPFQVQGGHTYADSIALVRDRLDFLSDADRQWMLRKTAEKVFFG